MLVSLAAAIALGATSMSDIALLAHLAPVLGDAPSGPTVRRALDLAGTASVLDRIARARAKARAHVRTLIEETPPGSRGWRSREDAHGLAGDRHGRGSGHRQLGQGRGGSHLEERLRLPPAGRLAREYPRVLAMLLRPATPARHLHRTRRCWPPPSADPGPVPDKILVRVDGAGASHELVEAPPVLSSPRRTVLFTCGWMITAADEDAIRQVPASAWKPGIAQDGSAEEDKDVAEITEPDEPGPGTGPAGCAGSPGG